MFKMGVVSIGSLKHDFFSGCLVCHNWFRTRAPLLLAMATLYADLVSQPCRALLIFARSAGVSLNLSLVNLVKRQQKSEEFLKLNPLGKARGDETLNPKN